MLSSRKGRIAALEQARGRHQKRHVAVFFLCLTQPITQAQQNALEAARAGRPTLVIRGTLPEVDPALNVVVEVAELGGAGSPLPDMTPVLSAGRWD